MCCLIVNLGGFFSSAGEHKIVWLFTTFLSYAQTRVEDTVEGKVRKLSARVRSTHLQDCSCYLTGANRSWHITPAWSRNLSTRPWITHCSFESIKKLLGTYGPNFASTIQCSAHTAYVQRTCHVSPEYCACCERDLASVHPEGALHVKGPLHIVVLGNVLCHIIIVYATLH